MSRLDNNKRCSYKKITEKLRLEIIERILEKGENIKDVSVEMNVNISTCKAIIKVYQEEGRIGKKKRRNIVYNVIETFSFFCVNDCNIEQMGQIKIEESKVSLERHENFDKFLEETAKGKAETMFEQAADEKNKFDETASQLHRQMMQLYFMQNGYTQYYNPPTTFSPESLVEMKEQEDLYEAGPSDSNSSSSEVNEEVKLQ